MTADADSSAVVEATTSFLEEHANGERALEVVLEADSASETWTFDDVAIDSGTFGELVSRGIVEKVDREYQLADPASVRATLDGEQPPEPSNSDESAVSFSLPSIDPWAMAGLCVALLVVAGARMTAYTSVFQRGYTISPANDPYYFRYWLDGLVAESSGLTDYAVLVDAPHGVSARRPFTHATNWSIAELLGGDQWAAETVAIWLPVVGSVALGVVLYKLALVLTQDVRVAIASVLVLAVTPVHAVYTGMGFLDHDVHQYFWTGVTLLTLGWLAVDLQGRLADAETEKSAVFDHLRLPLTWVAATVFGLAVAFGTHAWGGSPLLLLPLAGYIGLRVALDARANVPPLLANLPMLTGLALGSAVSAFFHFRWGWHSGFVALTPLFVLGGGIAVSGLGELWRRQDLHLGGLFALEVGVLITGLLAFRQFLPEEWTSARSRVDDLLFRDFATETMSLFSTEHAVILGPLYQLGMEFYIALAVLGWVILIVSRQYEPAWLLIGTYSGYLLILAGIQVRFAGQLAIPFSILGGLGFVYILSAVDLAKRPVPFRDDPLPHGDQSQVSNVVADGGRQRSFSLPEGRAVAYVLAIGLLVFGLSLVFVPSLIAQTTYSDAQVGALESVDEHAEEFDRGHPENFVFNEWGDNRMYNYFVSGESASYAYAQDTYHEFQFDSDPDGWYDEFEDDVGYVVVTDIEGDVPPESTQVQLLEHYGTGGDGAAPLAHYQLLSVDDDQTVAAFAVVPGATITAPGEPDETVPIETDVSVDGASFTYEREATVGDDGDLEVTVPYAGTYFVGDEEVEVTADDVENGETVRLE